VSVPAFLDPRRPLDRGPYLAIGLVLFAFKHNLDRVVAAALFGRRFEVFNYLVPAAGGAGSDARFYLALLALALPFIAVGTLLTLRRLRSVGWPPGLVLFFFVPVANLAFLLLLAATPAAPRREDGHEPSRLGRLIPHHPLGAAAFAVGLTAPLAALGAALLVAGTARYGWSLFVGVPFAMGLLSSIVAGWHRPARLLECIVVATVAVLATGFLLLATAVEGIICLAMALPVAAALAWLGAALGWAVRLGRGEAGAAPPPVAAGLVVPVLLLGELLAPPSAGLRAVVSEVEVDAPPERVFAHVVSFADLPAPTEWLFRAGVAYPVRARIEGRGVGAVRRCEFSTGAFVEPITAWDEPWRLAFDVASQPDPMDEWTPYPALRPPHLEGYFGARRGEFRLQALPGGRTRLVGTTWYEQRFWPEAYWRLWTDAVVHRIHGRVLRHIARQAAVTPNGP
jgi:hypothetical protein